MGYSSFEVCLWNSVWHPQCGWPTWWGGMPSPVSDWHLTLGTGELVDAHLRWDWGVVLVDQGKATRKCGWDYNFDPASHWSPCPCFWLREEDPLFISFLGIFFGRESLCCLWWVLFSFCLCLFCMGSSIGIYWVILGWVAHFNFCFVCISSTSGQILS